MVWLFREGRHGFLEQQHFSAMLPGELRGFTQLSECVKAGSAPVKAQRRGLLVAVDDPAVADAHIHIASPHDERVLRGEGLASQKGRQPDYSDGLSALLLFGE